MTRPNMHFNYASSELVAVLHLLFRPYKDPAGNYVVAIFSVSQMLGIAAKLFKKGSGGEILFQVCSSSLIELIVARLLV